MFTVKHNLPLGQVSVAGHAPCVLNLSCRGHATSNHGSASHHQVKMGREWSELFRGGSECRDMVVSVMVVDLRCTLGRQ